MAKRFLGIAALLVALVPATWVLQQFMVSNLERTTASAQEQLLRSAAGQIGEDFDRLQTGLKDRVLAVVDDPDAQFLAQEAGNSEAPDPAFVAAVRRFRTRHDAGAGASTELFDNSGRLVGWSGFSVLPHPPVWPPLFDGSIVVESDGYRKSLVLWYPVGSHGLARVVQVVQLMQQGMESTEAQDLSERWSRLIGRPVDVILGDPTTATSTVVGGEVGTTQLYNQVGDQLGRALISMPSKRRLIRDGARRFGDLQAVWFGMIMGWVFVGLWVTLSQWWNAGPVTLSRMVRTVGGRLGLLILLRFGFLRIQLPNRWFRGSDIAPLFDPVHLASSIAGGVARSTGDLLSTGIFSIAAAIAVTTVVHRYWRSSVDLRNSGASRFWLTIAASSAVTGVIAWHALLTRRAMLDATLDFFAWTGLTPEPLVLVVFCSLLLSTIAAVLLAGSLVLLAVRFSVTGEDDMEKRSKRLFAAAALIPPVALFASFRLHTLIPVWLFVAFILLAIATARFIVRGQFEPTRVLRLRAIVAVILVGATLLYPLVYLGMDAHRKLSLVDVADEFIERSDDQAVTNATVLLEQMASSAELGALAHKDPSSITPDDWVQFARSQSTAEVVPGVVSSRILLFDSTGLPIGGYEETRRGGIEVIPSGFRIERLVLPDSLDGPRVDVLRDPRSEESVGYAGIAPSNVPGETASGWLTVRFSKAGVNTPFGSLFGYSDWRRSLSLAEFKEGVRFRSEGENFEKYTLPADVVGLLDDQRDVWRTETIYGRAFLTYYSRRDHQLADEIESGSSTVVAARARAVIPYDHLYYLLRMALSGLWFGIPVFLVGLAIRWRRGELPAKRTQIADRVLDAFMLVGTLAVLVMGLVGQQVITRENEGAIRSRLQRRLERVEDALQRAAKPGESLVAVQERIPIDSLGRDLSLDLNVYRGPWLTEYSQMGGDLLPLMGYRLPPAAYDDLFLKRFRQSFVESTVQYGFVYTIGYKALMGADGKPASVVAVLTAPEQERIREERARTTAYFFGALLILLLVIMATATVLANALASPITKLRDGLKTVAEGRFQRPIPVESRDEVGELVGTFNLMQSQLAESRKRLAQQERELAWREMARQVAHEIKNPLTPMKLSIQHLQRAFEQEKGTDGSHFETAFRRITKTISEQIETLVNIANEFSTFARMPKRHLEPLDVNKIVREAIALLREGATTRVEFEATTEHAMVEADHDELRRVYINLIKNALQATTDHGHVTVSTRSDLGLGQHVGQRVIVTEITDTGSGVPDDVRDKIFQPNFSTKTSGMGLGLAIAKKSIEDIHGEIGFSSRDAGGSVFWVRLPALD